MLSKGLAFKDSLEEDFGQFRLNMLAVLRRILPGVMRNAAAGLTEFRALPG